MQVSPVASMPGYSLESKLRMKGRTRYQHLLGRRQLLQVLVAGIGAKVDLDGFEDVVTRIEKGDAAPSQLRRELADRG